MLRHLNGIVFYPIIVVKGDLVLEKINLMYLRIQTDFNMFILYSS